jgi:hypothetical protein
MRYWQARASLSRARSAIADEQPSLRHLIEISRNTASSLTSEPDRLASVALRQDAYRQLARSLASQGDTEGALEVWEQGKSIEGNFSAREFRKTMGGELRLSYVVLPDSVTVFAFDRESVRSRQLAPSRLIGAVQDIAARAPTAGRLPIAETKVRGLFDELLGGAADLLKPDRPLVIEPDGFLADLPFGLLRNRSGELLADTNPFVLSPGASWDALASPEAPSSSVLVVANPLAPESLRHDFPSLPDTLAEGDAVAAHFANARVITGASAGLTRVTGALRQAGLFHFAGHAVSSAWQTGLLLAADAPGKSPWLTASELGPSVHPQIAVLSACGAASSSDGTLLDPDNLVRAFLQSGTASVVASRWPVDSAGARDWMRDFYDALSGGATVAESARAAGRRDRSRAGVPSWIAFSVYGAKGISRGFSNY